MPRFVEEDAALARLEVELDAVRADVAGGLDEAGGGVDRARGADRDEQVAVAQRLRRCAPSRRASRRTRRCRGGPGRWRRRTGSARPAPLRPSRATACRRRGTSRCFSSPCMWIRRCEPARSWRSSTFCVTRRKSPVQRRSSSAKREVGGDLARPSQGGRGGRRKRRGRGQDRGAKASGVATSSTRCPSHRPSAARKVGTPLSAEIPAPVRMTRLRPLRLNSATIHQPFYLHYCQQAPTRG